MSRVSRSTLEWLRRERDALPIGVDYDLNLLAARLREQFATEAAAQQAQQIGAEEKYNVGGTDGLDAVEDGAPIMLDVVGPAP
jgi:hypothetical protein